MASTHKSLCDNGKEAYSRVFSINFRFFFIRSPITYAWNGGKIMSQMENFASKCMTREQYEEEGVRGVTEKFAI